MLVFNPFSGQYGERLDGQVSVQRTVRLDRFQDEPRSAQQQGPGGQVQGRVRNTLATSTSQGYLI